MHNYQGAGLEKVSDLTGESKAAIVRRLIWEEYERLHKPVEAT